jgi:hypothetical protein
MSPPWLRLPVSRTRRLILGATLGLAVVPATASAGISLGCDNPYGHPINSRVDWQTQVKPILNNDFGGRCTACPNATSPAGFLDLTDNFMDAIYNIVGSVVFPGHPWDSILFEKVNCEVPPYGARMPRNQVPLTLAQQGLIYDWIIQGAYGENPPNAIRRDFILRDGSESLRLPYPGL